jgi:hypothetical protein
VTVASSGGAGDGAASAETFAADAEARLRSLRILASALVLSVLFYVAVAAAVVQLREGRPLGGPLPRDSEIVAAGLAGALILISTRLRQRLQARPLRFPPAAEPEPQPARHARYQRAVVVSLALREAVGMIGLVYALLAGEARWAMIFGLASVLALLAAWPRRREMRRAGL